MYSNKNKGFVSSVMLAVGAISAFTMGAAGMTTEAFAPSSTMIGSLLQENVQIIDESSVVDGLSQAERIAKVQAYFERYDMPAAEYAHAFVMYADQYGIDWTLVPAIAFLESTGFKNSCSSVKHSGLGWGSCKISFSSYEESIRVVSMNLGGHNEKTAKFYSGKTSEGILDAYNPKYVQGISRNYHGNALAIMQEIKEFEHSSHLAKKP